MIRRARLRLLAALVALLAVAAALPPARAEAPLAIAPLAYHQRVLDNGLTVISLRQHGSPMVAVQVRYRVGARDDPPGRSGFAHLFEHLMFKRTRHLADEQFDRLTEDVGGENNAVTGDDGTAYLDLVPAAHLQRLLWAEAERMQHLRVDAAAFRSERAVVEEEFRTSVLTPPYGLLAHRLQQEGWRVHPYRQPAIGSLEDLAAATLDDVRDFHRRHYRPDNAALVVVGDFEPARFEAWVDRHFGPIPRPATPIPRSTAQEPPRDGDRRVRLNLASAPLPALGLHWLAPPPSSPDAPALRVAAAVLAGGEAARLPQALVHRRPAVQALTLDYDETVDRGSLQAIAILADGARLERVERTLLGELARLAAVPPAAAELDRARMLLLTRALLDRETVDGRAQALGEAWLKTGDPASADRALAALQAVSGTDVQRVVRRYLVEGRRLTLEGHPAPPMADPPR